MYTASGLKKQYGGVIALAGVDMEIHAGEVHALLGANGAGKSTLVKLLAGAEPPDAGHLVLDDHEVHFKNVIEATRHGVAIVSQELQIFPDLDVLSNLFLLREPLRGQLISWTEMARHAKPILQEIGLNVPLNARVRTLKLGDQQLVEIARALLKEPKVLILDEPNSALQARETQRLMNVIRSLRDRGVAIIYVSHFLEQVFEIADTITILRDGKTVMKATPRKALSIPEVVTAMIGTTLKSEIYIKTERHHNGQEQGLLSLKGVTLSPELKEIDFEAATSEVVGLAGLEGSGVRELLNIVFGERKLEKGSVTLPNGQCGPRTIEQAVKSGVALIPADRKAKGAMLNQTIYENISQVTICTLGHMGFLLRQKPIIDIAIEWASKLRIKAKSVHSLVGELSGGNQQKVVFAKWLQMNPTLVLLDDPTRGVDVGVKGEMHGIIRDLASQNRVVLFASTDMAELAVVCDRVTIFFQGKIVGDLSDLMLTEHNLLEAINTGIIPT